jgi:alkylation response protein AidB-like acyl-CoA dehydrogenase
MKEHVAMTTAEAPTPVLSQELLDGCAARAAGYDKENRFFVEDFEALKQAGYLKLAVPKEFGGLGMSVAELCREQRRLAYHAPATALAVNMHLYWTVLAASMRAMGDPSTEWMLEEAGKGEIFAAGHSESGNDLVGMASTTRAERVDGGYRFYGHKNFGSLTPVWTRLGLHAQDNDDPTGPKIVHAFLPRDTDGYRVVETWDTLGMRASRSDDTILDGAFVPDRYIASVTPVGFAGANLFVLCLFGAAEPTISSVYLGIAERLRDLAVTSAQKKTSLALGGKPMAYNPMIEYTVAEIGMEVEAMAAHLERIADDWSNGVDHGGLWPLKLVSMKCRVTDGARQVAKLALDVVGGNGIFKGQEFERLLRDVTLGTIHPANPALAHEVVGKTLLGTLGQQPRWG